jgi:hypothetical protein
MPILQFLRKFWRNVDAQLQSGAESTKRVEENPPVAFNDYGTRKILFAYGSLTLLPEG